MCDILDKVENKGKIEGKIEGKFEAYREIAIRMYNDGMNLDSISKYIKDIPSDEIQKIGYSKFLRVNHFEGLV